MEPIFKFLLYIHITGGFISLLLGSIILITPKGSHRHKVLGKIYFFALLAAAVVSLPMAVLHPNYFLFIVGVFTLYMLLSGVRYLQKKNNENVSISDWLLLGTMLVFGLGFVGFGLFHIMKSNSFGAVFFVFGLVSLFFVRADYKNYKGLASYKNYWLTTHIQRMVGSYIATATAFLVVNRPPLPATIAWLLPTVLLVPFIIRWSKKFGVGKN
jgi:uncharacterized membrane protein